MPSPAEFIAEARTWVGTPFHANQWAKGIGADCIGFIYGAAVAVGIGVQEKVLAYPIRPNGRLKPYLDRHLVRVDEPRPGDVLLMAFDREPHHLAIYAGDTIIHAYLQARKCVEQPMVKYWGERVRGIYRFREFA